MNIFITATDTDAGKTTVTAGIAAAVQKQGIKTGVYKPVQSGAVIKNEKKTAPDLDFVKKINPEIQTKVSYLLSEPAAPYTAAVMENIEIKRDKILEDYRQMQKDCNFVLTEGAGGLLTPVYKDFHVRDIVKMLELPVIIVARPDLGTINHTLLTIEAAKTSGVEVLGIIISNYPSNTNNIAVKTAPALIEEFSGVKVLGILPHIEGVNNDDFNPEILIQSVLDNINITELTK